MGNSQDEVSTPLASRADVPPALRSARALGFYTQLFFSADLTRRLIRKT